MITSSMRRGGNSETLADEFARGTAEGVEHLFPVEHRVGAAALARIGNRIDDADVPVAEAAEILHDAPGDGVGGKADRVDAVEGEVAVQGDFRQTGSREQPPERRIVAVTAVAEENETGKALLRLFYRQFRLLFRRVRWRQAEGAGGESQFGGAGDDTGVEAEVSFSPAAGVRTVFREGERQKDADTAVLLSREGDRIPAVASAVTVEHPFGREHIVRLTDRLAGDAEPGCQTAYRRETLTAGFRMSAQPGGQPVADDFHRAVSSTVGEIEIQFREYSIGHSRRGLPRLLFHTIVSEWVFVN